MNLDLIFMQRETGKVVTVLNKAQRHVDVWGSGGRALRHLNSALDGSQLSPSLPGHFTLGKESSTPIGQEDGWALEPVWMWGAKRKIPDSETLVESLLLVFNLIDIHHVILEYGQAYERKTLPSYCAFISSMSAWNKIIIKRERFSSAKCFFQLHTGPETKSVKIVLSGFCRFW
jgi:hypothetical protein